MESINKQKSDAFMNKMFDVVNYGALSLMISIGHRTGLFDQLAEMNYTSAAELAEKSGCNERYVQEWLSAMVMGEVVEYQSATQQYYLPPEHAEFLTRAASPNNMAVVTGFIPVLGSVEDKMVEVFKHGGGVPYDAFEGFHRVMAEESDQTILSHLIDAVLPLEPLIVDRLERGAKVCDIGCGSGHALNKMAEQYPNSTFVGYDISQEALTNAKNLAKQKQLSNIRFELQDVSKMSNGGDFDIITAFDTIHDQAKPELVLNKIHDALAEGGLFLMQDIRMSSKLENNFDNPLAAFIYTVSCLHCMTVSLAQRGKGLGAAWGQEQAMQMLRDAGFADIEIHALDNDILNDYYISKKAA